MSHTEMGGRSRLSADGILDRIVCLLLVIPFCEPYGLSKFLPFSWNYFVLLDGIILLLCTIWLRKGFESYLVLAMFYVMIVVSTLANSGDVFIAICYAVKIICFAILINLYAQRKQLRFLLSTFKLVLGIEILVTLFIQIFNHDVFGFTPSLNHNNFLSHDNDLGYWYLPFTLIVCLSDARKSKTFQAIDFAFWAGVCLASLMIAWSATCLSIYIMFIVFILLHKMKIFSWLTPTRALIANIVASVLVVFFQIQNSFSWLIENVLHKDLTLSSRTVIWASAIQNILKKPILGYGTMQGGRMEINQIGWGVYHFSHNIFLEITIQSGIIGLFFYILMHFFAARELKKHGKTDLSVMINISLFCILLMQFSEFALYEPFANLPLILCFFYKPLLQEGFARYSLDSPYGLSPSAAMLADGAGGKARRKMPAFLHRSIAVLKKRRFRFVWKPPIWLDEDDGRVTGIREENVSFGVFGTLVRRSVARPADLFRIMEQNDPRVPEHFAEKRMEAERAAFAKLGVRMGLADIYEELIPLYGAHTNDLMALEIQYEIAGCRPVADTIDLVNLCMEHDKNVFLMADTYLPSSVIRRMLDVCGVYHYDRLYVSCEEGACKADGSLFWKVLADQEIRPHELRHIGSDRQGDVVEPWRVGVHVKRGKKKDQSTVDKDLPEDVALYERTMQSCIRNCADDLDSGDARLGCETFGPLLAGFTAWLREQLRRDGIQDVYFLAGDGAVLKQAFDALEDSSFRTHSLYFPEHTADQDHEALLAYLRACGMQGRVALVDTGRQAAVQKTLEQLIVEAGLEIQVKGYYVGLHADTDGMEATGYLYEKNKGKETLEKLSPITAIFETVFHAQHGAVHRIAMRDGQPVPELDAYEYASDENRICDEIAILRAYQAGAIELVREMNEVFPGGVPQIPGEAVLLPLLRMGANPTLQEAELWGDFRVFMDGKATLMARPRGMGAYLLHPGQLKRDYAASPWKIGFLRRLVRLPLAYDKITKNR